MAEPRRVELVSSVAPSDQKKDETRSQTVRLSLTLRESSDETCPEFSFVDLLKTATEKAEDVNDFDPNDPFAAQDKAEHDKMVAVAKSFEAKYASKTGKRKLLNYRQRCEIRDLCDLGDGYDETDPFVDNTEAYDEYVPSCLTTKFGGFYINIGQLDFCEVSHDLSDGLHKKKRLKKHRILSDSEPNDSDSKEVKRKDLKMKENGKDIKLVKKRKRLSGCTPPAGVKLKRPPGRPPKDRSLMLSNGTGILPTPSGNLATANGSKVEDVVADQPRMSVDGCQPVADVENFSPPKLVRSLSSVGSANPGAVQVVGSTESEAVIDLERANLGSDGIPELPSSLEQPLLDAIHCLKKTVQKQSADSSNNSRLFTPPVTQLLLKVENSCRMLSGQTRSVIYSHLAKSLSCEKETLIKRAKKLFLSQHDDKLRQPIDLLKQAVSSAMPALLEHHRHCVNATEQLKRERMLDNKEPPRKDPGQGSDSDDNGPEENHDAITSSGGEKQKRIIAPRKKFAWTQEIRALLDNIVRIKMEHYEMAKVRSQTAEEYLKAFFEAELKPIWPQGWIQTRMLFKESRTAHHHWTSSQQKPKKLLMPSLPVAKSSTPATHDAKVMTPTTPNVTPMQKADKNVCQGLVELPLCPNILDLEVEDDDDYKLPQLYERQECTDETKPPMTMDLSTSKVSSAVNTSTNHITNGCKASSTQRLHPETGSSRDTKYLSHQDSLLASNDDSIEQFRSSINLDASAGFRTPDAASAMEKLQASVASSVYSKVGHEAVVLSADSRTVRSCETGESAKQDLDSGNNATSTGSSFSEKFSEFVGRPGNNSSAMAAREYVAKALSSSFLGTQLLDFCSQDRSHAAVRERVAKALHLSSADMRELGVKNIGTTSPTSHSGTQNISKTMSLSETAAQPFVNAANSNASIRQFIGHQQSTSGVLPSMRDQFSSGMDGHSKRSMAVVAPSFVSKPASLHNQVSSAVSPTTSSVVNHPKSFGSSSTTSQDRRMDSRNIYLSMLSSHGSQLGSFGAEPYVQSMIAKSIAKRQSNLKGYSRSAITTNATSGQAVPAAAGSASSASVALPPFCRSNSILSSSLLRSRNETNVTVTHTQSSPSNSDEQTSQTPQSIPYLQHWHNSLGSVPHTTASVTKSRISPFAASSYYTVNRERHSSQTSSSSSSVSLPSSYQHPGYNDCRFSSPQPSSRSGIQSPSNRRTSEGGTVAALSNTSSSAMSGNIRLSDPGSLRSQNPSSSLPQKLSKSGDYINMPPKPQ